MMLQDDRWLSRRSPLTLPYIQLNYLYYNHYLDDFGCIFCILYYIVLSKYPLIIAATLKSHSTGPTIHTTGFSAQAPFFSKTWQHHLFSRAHFGRFRFDR